MIATISSGQVFDGDDVLGVSDIHLDGDRIIGVSGGTLPANSDIVDASNCTLLPGLIDAHTHTNPDALRTALTFGVTTELRSAGHSHPLRPRPRQRRLGGRRGLSD